MERKVELVLDQVPLTVMALAVGMCGTWDDDRNRNKLKL